MEINMKEVHGLLEINADSRHVDVLRAIESNANEEDCNYLKGIRDGLWEAMKIIRFIEMNQEGE